MTQTYGCEGGLSSKFGLLAAAAETWKCKTTKLGMRTGGLRNSCGVRRGKGESELYHGIVNVCTFFPCPFAVNWQVVHGVQPRQEVFLSSEFDRGPKLATSS